MNNQLIQQIETLLDSELCIDCNAVNVKEPDSKCHECQTVELEFKHDALQDR